MRTFIDILKFVVQIFPFLIEVLTNREERKRKKKEDFEDTNELNT